MQIRITPATKEAELFLPPPKKASEYIPEWYRNMPMREPGYNGNQLSRSIEGPSNVSGSSRTLKGCNPFLDTLIGGYIFELAADVEFSFHNGTFLPQWIPHIQLVTDHPHFNTDGMPVPYQNTAPAFKWECGWVISTPPGYSTLFTHPFNRHDLPFRTFSGIVETDTYPLPTNFPFQILDPGTSGAVLIPKGTPICQAIPFKRDDWTSTIEPLNEEKYAKDLVEYQSKIDRPYRNKFWVRKFFK